MLKGYEHLWPTWAVKCGFSGCSSFHLDIILWVAAYPLWVWNTLSIAHLVRALLPPPGSHEAWLENRILDFLGEKASVFFVFSTRRTPSHSFSNPEYINCLICLHMERNQLNIFLVSARKWCFVSPAWLCLEIKVSWPHQSLCSSVIKCLYFSWFTSHLVNGTGHLPISL